MQVHHRGLISPFPIKDDARNTDGHFDEHVDNFVDPVNGRWKIGLIGEENLPHFVVNIGILNQALSLMNNDLHLRETVLSINP